MKISKKDALMWFEFFAALPEGEEIMTRQQEIAYAALAQIEAAVEARHEKLMSEIRHLKTLGNRTCYVGNERKFPMGCRSCLLGTGLSAIRKTNKCNLSCKFCYDYGELDCIPPIGEGLWEIGGTKFYEQDIDLLLSIQKKPTGISYVYLEPFMEIEKYYGLIRKFREAKVHQHCADGVIQNMRIAKKYIPCVGIETPMTPEFFEALLTKKQAILATGIDFINCAELHLNANNIGNYAGENLYSTRLGYISPIWSRELTLKCMKIADDEGWDLAVHDCSNHTKFARDLNLRAKEGGWFGASNYACEFPAIPYAAFLPVLRDDSFAFLSEEELPAGYRPGDIVL